MIRRHHLLGGLAVLGLTGSAHAALPSATQVLVDARAAAGGAAWDHAAMLEGSGRITTSGLKGRWQRTEDLRGGRFVLQADLGVFRTAEGHDGRLRWRQDPSGGVHDLNGAFARQATTTQAWLVQRGWLRAGAAGAQLGPVQEINEGDCQPCLVLEAQPRDGQPVQLWFDAKTHLLVRSMRQMPISTLTERYSDHRREAGLLLPHKIESIDSGSSDVETIEVEAWRTQASLAATRFARPTPPDDTTLDGETTVPIEIDGAPVVRATLNGRDYDFILDTGGHSIITPQVAKELGLAPEGMGASGGAGAGTTAQQYTRIDKVQIGAATMRDQHFYVLHFSYATVERGPRPPLAGLLGLELLERFGARLDYRAKTLTLRKLAGYQHRGGGVAVPITFDDDMPLLMGRIDELPALIALDTGNGGSTVIQPRWAQAHGMAERMKRDGVETVSYGAGGASRNWGTRLRSFEVGGLTVERPIVRYAEDSAGAFSSRTEAANIGTQMLAHFALDIDYGRGVIWFEPLPGYVEPPFNRAGLRAIKQGAEAFDVVLVSPDSPATAAGLAQGDRILAVDGKPAPELSGSDLRAKLLQPVGTSVRLEMQRGSEAKREVTLRLAEALP